VNTAGPSGAGMSTIDLYPLCPENMMMNISISVPDSLKSRIKVTDSEHGGIMVDAGPSFHLHIWEMNISEGKDLAKAMQSDVAQMKDPEISSSEGFSKFTKEEPTAVTWEYHPAGGKNGYRFYSCAPGEKESYFCIDNGIGQVKGLEDAEPVFTPSAIDLMLACAKTIKLNPDKE
jgi:hypothetical protein